MKIRVLILITGLTILYFVFFKILPYLDKKYHGCYIYQDINDQEMKSIVVEKLIDKANHNEETIIFSDGKKSIKKMIFPGYLEDMYFYLNIGDSVIKRKNSIYYRVKSKLTGKDTTFKLEVTCNDSAR